MILIGSFGEVNFLVSDSKIRTFNDFVRKCSARWAEHAIIGQKPKEQFIGPGLDTVSFTMRFSVYNGLNPRKEAERLIEMDRKGKPYPLTIGGKALGTYKWRISSLDIAFQEVDHKGNVLVTDLNIELKEYVK